MTKLPILLLVIAFLSCSRSKEQQLQATPAEVVAKVRKAAKLLSEQGSTGIEVLRDRNSEFTWKDTYVFVVDCHADLVLANPVFPKREGGDIKQHTDYNGQRYGLKLCETAGNSGGGWVEYIWPKPGGGKPLRKISFVMSVEGLPYQLGAGIYNETVSIEELDQLLEND